MKQQKSIAIKDVVVAENVTSGDILLMGKRLGDVSKEDLVAAIYTLGVTQQGTPNNVYTVYTGEPGIIIGVTTGPATAGISIREIRLEESEDY